MEQSGGRIGEGRLLEIRRQAELQSVASPLGATPQTGYYGLPILKEPPWTWEVPAYFFVGGAAGAAAVIAAAAQLTGADRRLVREARWIAAGGAALSVPLLIADLGRPERFLNMMRVFKPQSPMSVGVWTLLGFSAAATATAFADFMRERYGPSLPLRVLENTGQAASLAFGLPFSNYTGVLIGATAIPVWNQNVAELPIHFGASGLSAAVGMLEMMGHRKSRALHMLGLGAAIFESWEGWRIESRQQPALDPLKRGPSGWMVRTGGMLSGPVPAALRALSMISGKERSHDLRRWAGFVAVAGSLITRIAWVHAGHVSARDWREPLGIPHPSEPNFRLT